MGRKSTKDLLYNLAENSLPLSDEDVASASSQQGKAQEKVASSAPKQTKSSLAASSINAAKVTFFLDDQTPASLTTAASKDASDAKALAEALARVALAKEERKK